MADDHHACVPCGLHAPRRNAYFDGKLLTARDFDDEQAYHMGKRQLLNALLHGTGTVCGLKVVQHPVPGCRDEFAVIEKGLALDCCGQEIIVPADGVIPVARLVAADRDLARLLDGSRDLFVAIERCDTAGELAPVILADCDAAAAGGRPGRIIEGFGFHLFAALPGSATPAVHSHLPKLTWRHTLSFAGSVPRAIAIDEERGHVHVAVASEGEEAASRVVVYDRATHDLVTALDGPARPRDLQVSPVGDHVFLAGGGFGETAEGIGVYRKSRIREDAAPAGVIPLDGRARIIVRPNTGALIAFLPATGEIIAWSNEAVEAWLAAEAPAPEGPEVSHRFTLPEWTPGDDDGPAARGAATLAITREGRLLLIVCPDDPARALRLVDMALLFGGDAAPEVAAAAELGEGERAVAATWSLDSRLIHLLTERGAGETAEATLRRFERIEGDDTLRPRGRGARWAGVPVDLAVAPGERWAYALMRVGDETQLLAIDVSRAADVAGTDPATDAVVDAAGLAGAATFQRIVASGGTLYVAAADEDADDNPDRGLVAVVAIDEADCGQRFRQAVEGCAACADDRHHVIVAHLPGYRAGQRIVDAGASEDGAVIDNFTYRPIVPSSTTLKEVVECILAEGIAEGPPGPRGEAGDAGAAGADGPRGPGVTEVGVDALAAGSLPTVRLEAIEGDVEGDQRLVLGVPVGAAGANGTQGPRGPGIEAVVVEQLPAGTPPTARLDPIAGDAEGDLTLTLGIPAAGRVTPASFNQIIGINWPHNRTIDRDQYVRLVEDGVIVAFRAPVRADSIVTAPGNGDGRAGMSVVFEMLVPERNGNVTCWCPLDMACDPLAGVTVTEGVASGGEPTREPLITAVRLRLNGRSWDNDIPSEGVMRIIMRCDFVVDDRGRAVDGAHIGGRLPTGNASAGGLFESWFTVVGQSN